MTHYPSGSATCTLCELHCPSYCTCAWRMAVERKMAGAPLQHSPGLYLREGFRVPRYVLNMIGEQREWMYHTT